MNANGCAFVAASLDADVKRIRLLSNAIERAKLDGLTGRLSDLDAKALDAAQLTRTALLDAVAKAQAAYEDLAYRMRVCSRK